MKLNLFGNFGHPTIGYNIHAREFAYTMSKTNDVRVVPFDQINGQQWPAVAQMMKTPDVKNAPSVAITYGGYMSRFAGKKRVGWTVWETTRLPPDWVPELNNLDQLWLCSEWGKQVAIDSGVTVPIEVVPQGVPAFMNPYAPHIKALDDPNRFRFVSVFKWEKRKSPDLLVKAFLQEFDTKEPVDLVMQAFNPFAFTPEQWAWKRMELCWQLGSPFDSNIVFVDPQPQHSDMAALYASCNCFVLPTKGEAWCAPAIEAMACGVPCIIPNWGGQTAFVNEENSFLLKDFKLTNAEQMPFIPAYEGSQWIEPNLKELRAKMRYAFEHRKDVEKKGLVASEFVHSNFTWDHVAAKATKCLEALQ